MLGISTTHLWLITNSFPNQWDNQIHPVINTKSVLQGHHCATQDQSSVTETEGLSCVFSLAPSHGHGP